MNYTFLYAGQGAQKVGMGKDFYEKYETFRKLADSFSFDFDHKALMHEGPLEELSKTENTQPCMAVFAAGVTEILKENGISPAMAMGLSLGEYGALYAAGVFAAEEYVKLTRFRGKAMAEAAKGMECVMSAILGVDAQTVKLVCEEISEQKTEANPNAGYVTVANYNCPGQYVICGEENAVAAVEAAVKNRGAKRCVRLNVSGPFHTKFMKPAGEALAEYFENMTFADPSIPILLNYTGDFYQRDVGIQDNVNNSIKDLLIAQVQNSVRLEDSLKKALESGAEHFIEIGPGNTLTGFLKKCAREKGKKVTIHTIETVSDLEKLLTENKI